MLISHFEDDNENEDEETYEEIMKQKSINYLEKSRSFFSKKTAVKFFEE